MKKLFTKEECLEVIQYAESKNSWTGGKINLPHLKNIKVESRPKIVPLWDLEFFRERLLSYAKEELNLDIKTAGIYVMKYNTGDWFPRHKDRNEKTEFNMDFLYNINVVLNDEFEGGEFYIEDKLITYNTPGMVYHYKSDVYHEVKPVTKGTRYSALFFVRDRDIKNIYKVI